MKKSTIPNGSISAAVLKFLGATLLLALCLLATSMQAATLTVINGDDSGSGSLRDAIALATSGDIIEFSGVTTVSLTSAQLLIDKNLTINGGTGNVTITRSGGTLFRILNISSGVVVMMNNLTITNGNGGVQSGGIENNGTLTLIDCTISGNTAGQGGGVQNNSVLTMNGCTVSGNSATSTFGGGVVSFGDGPTILNNCTISGNTANNDAAGIGTSGTWLVTNCTIVNNTAATVGGGVEIYSANVTLKNTIVALNTANGVAATGNLDGSVNLNAASAHNLIGTGATLGLTNGVNGNQTGVTNVLLGSMGNYGGTTQTFPLLPGSPAINAGTNSGAPATDQRGIARPQQSTTDIGAFESRGFTLVASGGNNQSAFINTNFSNPLSVTVTATGSGEPVDGGRITLTPPGSGASATIAGNPATITNGIALSGTVTANGTIGMNYTVTASATGATPINFTLSNTTPPTPVLGSYATTSVNLSQQTTVTPSAAPTNTTSLVAIASSNFKGTLRANPTTGVVSIVNAHPAGTHTITVNAFGPSGMTTTTFQLTVQNGTACGTVPLFTSAANVTGVSAPLGTAVGDFNNDGNQDLVTANGSNATASIRLGDGAGGFTAMPTVSTPTNPNAVAVGDFNGDGNQDIAVSSSNNSVVIWRGDGTGGFTGSTNITTGQTTKSIALGDFNNDGKLDFVTANIGGDNATVALGNGAGGFPTISTVSVGDGPGQVVVADFNNDGNLDFATSNQIFNSPTFGSPGTVTVRIGNGDGTFTNGPSYNVGDNPEYLAVGDFNEDGTPDLITSNQGSASLSLILGDVSNTVTPPTPTTIAVSSGPGEIHVADINNDGHQDVAFKRSGFENFAYLLGTGTGSFGTTVIVSVTGAAGTKLAVGDFNGDGRQDFVTANFGVNTLFVRLGGCNLAPTITAGGPLTRQRGSTGTSATIATVNDTETLKQNLTVTVMSAPTGVSVTSISAPDATTGVVTATVTAACNAATGNNTVVLTVTDGNGTTATANLTVNVTAPTPPTTADAGPDQPLCAATPATLAANTPSVGTGAWSVITGPSTSTAQFSSLTNPAATFTPAGGPGSYTLRWTVTASCSTTSTNDVILNYAANPSAANAGSDQMVCGTATTLAANVPSAGTGTWSIITGMGGSFVNANQNNTVFNGTTGTTYTLRWTVANSPCAASTDDVVIALVAAPSTAAAGADQPVCGTSATLAATAPTVGTGAWSLVNGPGTANFSNSASPTSVVTVSSTGVYTLRWTVTNAPCAASTDDVDITFNPSSTSPADAGPNQTDNTTCGQTTVTLAATAPTVGTGMWSIQSGTGGSFSNASSPNATFSGNPGATYTLRWTVTNPPCSPNTDEMIVTFNQNPSAANAGLDQTGNATCGLTNVTLGATAPTVGTGMWSVQSGTGGTVTTPSSPTSTFSGTAGNTYTLRWTVSNSPCAASTDDVVIAFNQSPSFSACPTDVTVNASSNCSATATYTAAAATTTPAGTVSYAFGGATLGSGTGSGSGSSFNLGTTTVNLTVTNTCGTNNCSFSVVVQSGEINVRGNNMDIADGDNMPSTADHTDFGQTTGASVTRTFTVQNTDPNAPLGVTGIALSGLNANQFSVGPLMPASPVPPNGSATFTVTYAPNTTGVHDATITVTNGDCSEALYDFAVRGELTCSAPTFTACPTAMVELNTPANGCAAIANYTVSANGLPAPDLTYVFTGATTGNGNGTGSGLSFNKGVTTVTVTATNPCGAPTCSFSVRVTDNVPPTITCPTPMTVSNSPGQCGATVTYTPTVSDNCPGTTFTALSGLASGSLFPTGTTTMQLQATDAAGLTSACSFTVRVNDTELPSITCPNNIIRQSDANACGAIVTYTNPTYSDNCPGAGLDHLSGGTGGSSFPVGNTTVIWMATDAANNTRTCSFSVTVMDAQLPAITCPANMARPTTTGQCAAQVTFNNPTASDNCAVPTLQWVSGGTGTVQGPTTSTGTFNKGTTTVQWKATDAAGLTKTCTFRIIVNDLEAPTMSCPSGLNASASPGQCVAAVTYSTPTYTDNCAPTSGTAVRVSGPPSGSIFPVGTTNVVFRATDAASNTRQCTLTVTVTDNQPPSINCPPSTVVTGNGTPCRATVFYNAPTASDNCAGTLIPYLVSGLASGSNFPAGTTVNTWRATAPNGQTAQCAVSVTVNCPTNQPLPGTEDRTEAASGLWLTPNPAATAVTISIQGDQDASFGSLSVRDAAGRLVWEQTIKSSATLQLDVSAWPGGVYAVLWRQGKTATVKRLMVVKG